MSRIGMGVPNWVIAGAGAIAAAAVGAGVFISCASSDDSERIATTVMMLNPSPLSGAIFTTLVDGSSVNHNIYEQKEAVYLDGGPGPNAPSTAAGLPEGNYFFQVTDPSGKDLLSTDHISCRKIRVNNQGVLERVYAGTNYRWHQGSWQPAPCQHQAGVDQDHAELGAVTVQLFPFDDTPNQGGVYKVWVTPVDDYAGDPSFVPQNHKDAVNGEHWEPGNAHGFVPAYSKTDNFKVKGAPPCVPAILNVRKFHDANVNGFQDAGEPNLEGWRIAVGDPLGGTNNYFTTAAILASEGTWTLVEDVPAATWPTAAYVDGARMSVYPAANPAVTVDVANGCGGEIHEIVFGNVGLGNLAAHKVYDRDGDGQADDGEPNIAGWQFSLSGTDVTGTVFGPVVAATDADGRAYFADLLPGTYTVTEMIPTTGGWLPTGPEHAEVTIESMVNDMMHHMGHGLICGTCAEETFTNVCTAPADFDTKGYWHNKNGLTELTDADIAYANTLLPYSAPSSYFGDGDEPFDGLYQDGRPVAAAFNENNEVVAPAGSARAEVSHFLVDANATGDPREQLAQQLLAFIFNTRHRLDDPSVGVRLPDGSFQAASALIDEAIGVWADGTAGAQNATAALLDGFNNSDALPFVPTSPCSVTYP